MAGLGPAGVRHALRRTANTTAMIFCIVIAASIFGYFLTATQFAQDLIRLVEGLPVPAWTILLLFLGFYLLLGAFLDPVSILILALPLTFPLVMALGYDAIWFGIIATKMIEIGLVTPPVGVNVFVTAGAVNANLQQAFTGAGAFVCADLVVLALLILFPEIVTFLPALLFG